MEKIQIEQYLDAVTFRANHNGIHGYFHSLTAKEKAICEANVFFFNKIIDELNFMKLNKITEHNEQKH